MKTILITAILTIVFLSAGAFAGNSIPAPHQTSGFSVIYKTSN